jgi:hypothetical protein
VGEVVLPPSKRAYRNSGRLARVSVWISAKDLTTQQLLRLTELTTRPFNIKKSKGAVLLDIEKTFEQVWHEGLLHKLRSLPVPHGLYNVLKSYQNGRVFRVRVGDTQSLLSPL